MAGRDIYRFTGVTDALHLPLISTNEAQSWDLLLLYQNEVAVIIIHTADAYLDLNTLDK
jgi:hypothetical protein